MSGVSKVRKEVSNPLDDKIGDALEIMCVAREKCCAGEERGRGNDAVGKLQSMYAADDAGVLRYGGVDGDDRATGKKQARRGFFLDGELGKTEQFGDRDGRDVHRGAMLDRTDDPIAHRCITARVINDRVGVERYHALG